MGFLDRFKKKSDAPPPAATPAADPAKAEPAAQQPPAAPADEPTVRVGPADKTVLAPAAGAAPPAEKQSAPPAEKQPAPAPAAKTPAVPPPAPPRTPPPPEPAPAAEPPKKGGFFAKIREGLKKTTRILNTDIRDLFKSEGRLVDDAFLDELLEILIKTDMGVVASQQAIDQVRTDFRGRVVHIEDVVGTLKSKFKELLKQPEEPIRFAATGTTVIMVAGVNGAGKTTSIAKLARTFIGQGKKVVLGAGDTFRAAAVEQLTVWAGRLGAEIVTGEAKSDPASVAHRAVAHAVETGADVCIVDTAGRLQTQQNLMKELTKIHNVIGKKVPGAPHEVLLVLDATTGQNGISQAKSFSEAVQCTGIVLAKIDGTAKGGVVIAIRQQVGLPVKYLGVGEKAEDMTLFNPDQFVEAMFEDLMPSGNAS
ncbi:MAG TPA: signal recognition particle-docking protein FtsY [Pirellulales bacterium]|jgi:fused signal recognition particle receptor